MCIEKHEENDILEMKASSFSKHTQKQRTTTFLFLTVKNILQAPTTEMRLAG